MLNVEKYIVSGIVESYVLGLADQEEKLEFEQLLPVYPQLRTAMLLFEIQLEHKITAHAGLPPAYIRSSLLEKVNKDRLTGGHSRSGGNGREEETIIPIVSGSNDHIRVHKYFRHAFIVLIILSKIFLYLAIYYYLMYKDQLKQNERLEHQIQQTLPVPAG